MINMYLQILLRLNLIIVFLLLIRKMVGNKLRKKFVYGLWIVVPVFLLSFPFVRVPQLFHWEMNLGNLIQIEKIETTPQEFVTQSVSKELSDPTQMESWNQDETLNTNGILVRDEMQNEKEILNQNESLNLSELRAQKEILNLDELLTQNEVPNQHEVQIENAEPMKTQASVQSVTSTATPANGIKLSTIVSVVYLGIVGILLLCMILSNVLFHNSCKKKRIFLRKSEDAGLAVYHLEGIASPFLMGKTIYLPTYMVEEEQIRYAILHEESHYLHGDAFWVIVRYLVLAIYFYDPIIWLAFFASGHDCELACDEEVLGKIGAEESSAYGACLLGSLEQKFQKPPRMVMTTNMSTGKKFMKERIVNIVNKKKKSRITMAIAAVIMVTVVGCSFEKSTEDTSEQESLVSEIEETTEESVVELAEETDTEETVNVTESDEVADNTSESNDTGESNSTSEDDFTLPDLESSLIEDYQADHVLFSIFKDNEKPDTENYKDFKYDLDWDGELDTITLKNQEYGSNDFSLFLNGEEFYHFSDSGVGVYIVDLFDKKPGYQVAACYEDPSGDGLNYSIFRKQGEKMIYSGELKSKYFTQPDTDLYTIEEDALECELNFDGTSYENPDYVKDFKYDLDRDGEIDTITIKRSEEPKAVAGDGADLKRIKLYLNGEEFYKFIYDYGASVYIIELNKEDGTLGVVAYDDGPSGDPGYTIFRKQGEEMECIMETSEYSGCMFDKMGRIYTECAPVLDPPLCNVCYDLRQDTVKKYRSNLKEVENVWYTSAGVFVNELDYMPDFLDIPENVEFKVLEKGYYPFGTFLGYKVQFKDGKVGYLANGLCWGD